MDSDMKAKETLLAAFDGFRNALMACDTEALDRLLASDYRSFNLQGQLEGRDVVLEAYAPGVTTLDRWETEGLRVDVFSEVGVITGKGIVAGRWQGQPWSHKLRFCDIWVVRDERWQALISLVTPMEDDPPVD